MNQNWLPDFAPAPHLILSGESFCHQSYIQHSMHLWFVLRLVLVCTKISEDGLMEDFLNFDGKDDPTSPTRTPLTVDKTDKSVESVTERNLSGVLHSLKRRTQKRNSSNDPEPWQKILLSKQQSEILFLQMKSMEVMLKIGLRKQSVKSIPLFAVYTEDERNLSPDMEITSESMRWTVTTKQKDQRKERDWSALTAKKSFFFQPSLYLLLEFKSSQVHVVICIDLLCVLKTVLCKNRS